MFFLSQFQFSPFGQKKKKKSLPAEEVNFFPVLDPENAGLLFKFPTGGNDTWERLFGEKTSNARQSSDKMTNAVAQGCFGSHSTDVGGACGGQSRWTRGKILGPNLVRLPADLFA